MDERTVNPQSQNSGDSTNIKTSGQDLRSSQLSYEAV